MPMVFISHSSEHGSGPVREEIQRQIKARGWDVKVDVDALQGGDEWKSVLYNWLADSDAAVVIVGRKAIASPWVKREVNLLLWRHGLGSPITIVPVLLADVSDADVRNSEISEVLDFQVVRAPAENLTQGQAQELARHVAEALPDISGALPSRDCDGMRRWLANLVSCLREVDETALRAAVQALKVADDLHFPSIGEGRRFLAYQMLAPDLAGHVHLAVEAIAWQAAAQLGQLLPLVMPTWVDGEAARLLLPNRRQQVFAFLNARRAETAEQYVQRAACCSPSYHARPVTLIAGEEQHLEFMQACEAAVRRLLDLEADDPLEGVEPLEGQVGFLVVDPDNTPIDAAVDELRPLLARFRWLNVILLTGETCPDPALVAREGLGGVVLRPELAAATEFNAARIVRHLRNLPQEIKITGL